MGKVIKVNFKRKNRISSYFYKAVITNLFVIGIIISLMIVLKQCL